MGYWYYKEIIPDDPNGTIKIWKHGIPRCTLMLGGETIPLNELTGLWNE